MEYCACKKVLMLLDEWNKAGEANYNLRKDLIEAIWEASRDQYIDFFKNKDEVLKITQYDNLRDFIDYLEDLEVSFAEEEAEYEIGRSEAMAEFIYENGYEEFANGGFTYE